MVWVEKKRHKALEVKNTKALPDGRAVLATAKEALRVF